MNTEQLFDSKYKILRLLGQGGMSKVFLAENVRLNTLWAIKEIPKKNMKHLDLTAEPQVMKNLRHPSLPRIFDIIENEDYLYIIQDYIEGTNVANLIRMEGAVGEERALKWAKQITDVFIYLHNMKPNPIIYRDMKPSNLIVDREDNVKVIDFGIAREYKDDSSEDTTMLGTRGYAAPEQYGGSQTDGRTDIYSLGITLYHILTGISPNDRTFDFSHLDRSTYLSREFIEIIERCTEYDAGKRYGSAEELLQALNALNAHEHESPMHRHSIGSTQIALLGASNGCGVTHTSFMLANLLNKHYKVAVVEMNSSKDFQEIQYAYDGRKDGKQFRIKNVDYFKMVDEMQLIEIANHKYDFIVLDLGSFDEIYDIETFLRADIKMIMSHGSDWKTRHLDVLFKELGFRDKFNEWKICIPFIPEKMLGDIKEDYTNDLYSIPYHVNPFKLNKETEEVLIRMVEKMTRMKLFKNKKKSLFGNTLGFFSN